MSFIGAVSSSVRKVLAEYAQSVSLPPLIVGAGNFTVPSVLRSGGYTGPIKACDVTIYTSALGAYLSGWDLELHGLATYNWHVRHCCGTGGRPPAA